MPKTSIDQRAIIPDREAEICKRLREARLNLGLQQKDAARHLEIPIDTFRTYEYARVALRFQVAWRFATSFRINLMWLATGADEFAGHHQVSSDLARFIPSSVLLSTVFDSVIKFFPQTKFMSSNPSGGMSEKSAPIGINEERIERNLRDSKIAYFQSIFRVLPAELATEFANLLDAAIGEFIALHGLQMSELLSKGEGHNIASNVSAGLAANAAIVGDALGLDSEALIVANRSFPVRFLDSDYEPPRSSLESAIVRQCAKPQVPRRTEAVARYRELLDNQEKIYIDNIFTSITPQRNLAAYENNPPTPMQKRSIAQRIVAALDKTSLTQGQAAEKWGISRRSLENWAQGRREPRGLYRERIEKILSEIEGSGSGKKFPPSDRQAAKQ